MIQDYAVDCVIVTYNPDMMMLNSVLDSIAFQVRNCYIINNSNFPLIFNKENVAVMELGKNYGIAYAQNRGIELARTNGADFILFSDQDTIYPNNFTDGMLDVYSKYPEQKSIGALVPRFYDKNKMRATKIPIDKFKYIIPDKDTIYCIAHAVSSGTLVPIKILDIIGVMREELFIDWVDFEWCCRILKYGYKIISVPNISIEHKMGDGVKKLGNKKITLRSRVRYYYMIRNGLYIIFHIDLLTVYEKILFMKDLFIKYIGICAIEKNIFQLLCKAVYDGIHGDMHEIKNQ
jgi:rhamnosyltransferase